MEHEGLMKELEKQRERLLTMEQEVFARQTENEHRLIELKNKLPELLLMAALGKGVGDEISEVKKEINALEESLRDAPLIFEAIKAQLETIKAQEAKALREAQIEKAEQPYEQLLSTIPEKHFDRWHESRLLQTAHEVGKTEEAKQAIQAWKDRLRIT